MPGVGGWEDGKAPALGHLSLLQGFQVAYVVFQKPSGVLAALALKGPLLVSTESHPVKSGIHSQYCGRVGGPLPGPGLEGEVLWGQHLPCSLALRAACARPEPGTRVGRGEGPASPLDRGPQSPCLGLYKMLPAGLSVGLRKPRVPPSFSLEWISDYTDSVLDPEALRVEVDTFMEAYDKRIAEVGLPHRWLLIPRVTMGKVALRVSWCGSRGEGPW